MPGYTHTRAAEPITFGFWAAAHAWGLVRDRERLRDARVRVDVMPLGSGALAGASLPLDRDAMAKDLGFAAVSPAALDAVMDRDFAVELVSCCAQVQTHLARLSEDLIHFAAPEYGFVTLPEAFTTGSSLMPQKKNPDALELVRGKAARVDADLLRLLVLLKGLPAGYQKDLQEDKEAVFDAVDTAVGSVAVMTGVVAGLGLQREVMRAAAGREEMMAAGLAVALAREGMPFRKAHHVVGALVADAQKSGRSLKAVAKETLASVSPKVAARLDVLFDPLEAVKAKSLVGGAAPDAVRVLARRGPGARVGLSAAGMASRRLKPALVLLACCAAVGGCALDARPRPRRDSTRTSPATSRPARGSSSASARSASAPRSSSAPRRKPRAAGWPSCERPRTSAWGPTSRPLTASFSTRPSGSSRSRPCSRS